MELPSDWLDFLRALKREEVNFVIIGGVAVIFHGYPRTTGDLDVFYESSPENVRRLLKALTSFFKADLALSEEELVTPGKVIQLGLPPNRIDLINQIEGVAFSEARNTAVNVKLQSAGSIPFIGRSALLKNKKVLGRNRDKDDLEFLDSKS